MRYRSLLDNKNIDAKTNSNDIKAIAKAFVGKRDLSKMTLAERELFYFKLRALPRFEQPTKLPKNFFTSSLSPVSSFAQSNKPFRTSMMQALSAYNRHQVSSINRLSPRRRSISFVKS